MGRGAGESFLNFAGAPIKEPCFEFADYLSRMMDRSVYCVYFCVLLPVLHDYDIFKGDLDLIALKED